MPTMKNALYKFQLLLIIIIIIRNVKLSIKNALEYNVYHGSLFLIKLRWHKTKSSYHEFILGYYAYIETSHPRRPGDKAKLVFKSSATGVFCLKFFYHMLGNKMGTLNVFSGNKKIFTKSGNQGDKWLEAESSFTSSGQVNTLGRRFFKN